jgi:hypothetical protein
LLAIGFENAGHANFFSYNSFHSLYNFSQRLDFSRMTIIYLFFTYQALISTSTPDGKSSFESASTVFDEEV